MTIKDPPIYLPTHLLTNLHCVLPLCRYGAVLLAEQKRLMGGKMSPELRWGLGRVCPLSSPAWWDGWRNCCWEARRWDGWYRLSREWRKFTWRKEKQRRRKMNPPCNINLSAQAYWLKSRQVAFAQCPGTGFHTLTVLKTQAEHQPRSSVDM